MQKRWMTGIAFGALLLVTQSCASQDPQSAPEPEVTQAAQPETPPVIEAGGATEVAEETGMSGKMTYETICAACHENPNMTRAVNLAGLKRMPKEQIEAALGEGGMMEAMAASLSLSEKAAVVEYLTKDQDPALNNVDWTEPLMCAADDREVDLGDGTGWTSFGYDRNATRYVPGGDLGLTTAGMSNLEVDWAIGFPRTTNVSATPVSVGPTVFINGGNKLAAFDTNKSCVKWVYDGGFSRSPITYGEIDGTPTLLYAVGRKEVDAVNALTGERIWRVEAQPKRGDGGSIRPGVTLYGDKIIVPISASGVGGGGNYCCTGHGAVVVLNASDGSWVWEYHTMEEATDNGLMTSDGKKMRGPSGAPVWTPPTVDVKRNRVIITTGENTSFPATDTSDAIIALDLETGEVDWQFQAMENDLWNVHCRGTTETAGPNCPWHWQDGEIGRDFDFGSAAVLATATIDGTEKDLVLAGQKSGHLWALDAETGDVIWSQRVGEGTPLGGNHWGIAVAHGKAYLTINDVLSYGAAAPVPGVYAFDLSTGNMVWEYRAQPDCDGPRAEKVMNCAMKYGFSATPLVVDGVVVAGTLDGKLFTFNAETGEVLQMVDTVLLTDTINGVEGVGGSIDSHAVGAGNGMLLIGSGYGSFSQTPGNMLIALKPAD